MKKQLLLVLCFLCASATAFALTVPERPDGYVNDYAGLLSAAARARLEQRLGEFERSTSNQVVVAVFPSLEAESLEDFSHRLAEKWGIGRADKDNGAVLLIFKNDRQVRIETGYGLEGALPDAVASRIIRERIVPAFREGDYDRGVEGAVDAIILATKGEYKSDAVSEDAIQKNAPFLFMILVTFFLAPVICFLLVTFFGGILFGFPAGILFGLIAAAVLMVLRGVFARAAFGQTLSGHGRGPFIGPGGWGGSSGGSFGGGFGGGGGGSFGGGGASGRW